VATATDVDFSFRWPRESGHQCDFQVEHVGLVRAWIVRESQMG